MNAIALPYRQGTDAWLEARKAGFGSSDAAAAVGLDPEQTPEELVAEKIGLLPPRVETPRMRLGKLVEPLIASLYEDQTGTHVRRRNLLLQHPKYPFVLASLDRERIGERRIVELKKREGLRDYGEPGTDEVPEKVLVQVQQQLLVLNYPVADVAVWDGDSPDVAIYHIEADREFHELIVDVEADLYDYVQRHELPPESERAPYHKTVFSGDLVATEEIVAMALRLAELKGRIALDAAEKSEVERNLLEEAADHKRILGDDFKLTVVAGGERSNTSWQRVSEGYRELALQLWGALELLPGDRPYPIALSDKRPLESLFTNTSEVAPSLRTYGALFERKEATEE